MILITAPTIDSSPLAGSTGTQSQCFQLLKETGSLTMKNGTIVADNSAVRMMIQNYCSLTLDSMTLDATTGTNNVGYVLSNNCGNTTITGSTTITAKSTGVAFDVFYWPSGGYTDGVSVTIDSADVEINGTVEYGSDGSTTGKADVAEKAKLTISEGTVNGEISVTDTLDTDEETGIAISGGTFSMDVSAYAVDGYEATETYESSGVYTITALTSESTGVVASLTSGGTTVYYKSLANAFAAAVDGDTVTLLGSITNAGETIIIEVTDDKSITLDLGSSTLSDYRFYVRNGSLTVQNGTIADTSQPFNVYGSSTDEANYSVLTIESTATISGATWGICLFPNSNSDMLGYGAVINVAGTIKETGVGIFVSGNLGNSAETATAMADSANVSVVNVTGTIETTGQAIAMNGYAVVNISGDASLTGSEAVGVKRGVLNVSGGTLTATGDYVDPATANYNGTESTGAAISVTSTYNYAGVIEVNVTGGTITSTNGNAVYVGHSGTQTTTTTYTVGVEISLKDGTYTGATGKVAVYVAAAETGDANTYTQQIISGGTYSSDVTTYCVDGYEATVNQEGTYGITAVTEEQNDSVASITTDGTTVYYKTLAGALAAATDGSTITLLADISITKALTAEVSGTVTIDLAGYDLTIGASTDATKVALTIAEGTTVIFTDSSSGTTGVVANYGTITADGTLDISALGYTTDGTTGGLMGGLSGKISIGAKGTFTVPDVWATLWSWDPNLTSATSADGIFSTAEKGATVVCDGSYWKCTTEFAAGDYQSGTTYWSAAVATVTTSAGTVTYYTSLADAVEAAASGETITLIKDISESSVTVNKSVTIDLNNCTLATSYIYVATNDINVTVENGKITGSYGVYLTAGSLTLDSCTVDLTKYAYCSGGELTLKSTTLTSSGDRAIGNYDSSTVTIDANSTVNAANGVGVVIWGDGSGETAKTPILNVYGKINANVCVQGNGTDYSGTIINIYSGAVLTATTLGMYLPQPCTVNITDATVTGSCAIGIKSGTLNITGNSTISGTGEYDSELESTRNGINVDGSAIVIDSYAGYAGDVVVNIYADDSNIAPTISSTNAIAIREISNSSSTNVVSITISAGKITGGESAITVTEAAEETIAISGGTYSSDVSAYCIEGLKAQLQQTESGLYVIVTKYEAAIGETTYRYLEDALKAAANDDTITLLEDVTLSDELTVDKTGAITLDLAGCDLTIAEEIPLTVSEGTTVTITDSDTEQPTGVVANYGTISVNGALDISTLGYTTDGTTGGLMGGLSGKISIGSTGTFTVPDVWATLWSWDPNMPSATSTDGIFSAAALGAKVVSGTTWTCTTAFEADNYDNSKTYWTLTLTEGLFNVNTSSETYTGSAIVGKVSSETLTVDKDYTVTYNNNTNVGTATITIEGIGSYTGTLVDTFEITKATPTNPTTPTPSAVTYDPTQTLNDIELSTGWTWADSSIVPTVVNSGYTAYYVVSDDTNYDWSQISDYNSTEHRVERTVTLTVNASQLATPTGLTWSGATATVTASWDEVTTASSYTVQLYKDGAAEGSAVSVTTGTSTTFTITDAGSYTFTVTAVGTGNYSDSTVSATSEALNFYTVTWSYGDGSQTEVVMSGSTPTNAPTNPTKATDDTYIYTFSSWSSEAGAITADTTYTAQYSKTYVAPTEGTGYTIDYSAETATATEGYEISTDGSTWSTNELTVEPSGTLYVRRATDTTASASEATTNTFAGRLATPTVSNVDEAWQGEGGGQITGVTTAMEYSADGDTWTVCTGTVVDNLAAGTYYVRYKATDSAFASEATSVTIASGKTRTYTLTVEAPTFAEVTYGYTQPAAASITITSTGNSDATITGVTVGSTNFTIGTGDSTVTAQGTNTSYTIQPVAGLAADTYTATITVAYTGGATATDTVSFTVGKAAPSVGTVTCSDTIYTSTALADITLTRTDTSVAGTLALDAGQTLTAGTNQYNWTFTPSDTANYDTLTGTVELTVTADSLSSIAVTTAPTKTTYTYGETFDSTGMAVTATYASGSTADVTSSATVTPETLTVDTTAVTLTYGGLTTTVAITVNPKAVSNPTITLEKTTYDYTGAAFEPSVTVKDGETTIPADEYTVTYSNNTDAGTATVTITDAADGNYTVNGSATFTITQATQTALTITSQPETVKYGDTFTLTTSGGSGDGAVTWEVTDGGSYANVDADGNVTIIGVGDVTITATKAGGTNYEDVAAVYSFTSQKATPAEVIFPTASSITYGATLASSEFVGGSGDGKFAWDAPDTVPTVSNSGYSVTFTPNDATNYDYSGITLTQAVAITVNAKAVSNPTIELAYDSAVYSGSALEPAVTVKDGETTIPASEYTVTYSDNTNAGTAVVTITDAADGNYTVNGETTFTITRATLTVTADSKAIYVGAAVPTEYTYSTDGWQGDDTDALLSGVTVSCAIENSDTEDRYDITVTGPTDLENYEIAYVNGTLTVATLENEEVFKLNVVEVSALNEVPYVLSDTYATVDELAAALREAVIAVNTSITSANTAVYDVNLQVSYDGGDTWVIADEEHFPENGELTVTLPYPDGTNRNYTFNVTHMFTSTAFGQTIGGTEAPEVTKTATGVQFVVTGLSPIAVGWVAPAATGGGGGGGGSSTTSRAITIDDCANGTVTADSTTAASGATVTLTVTPDEGYALESITVTGSGSSISVTKVSDTEYTFTMPSAAVTVTAVFTESEADTHVCYSEGFTDVNTEAWYHEYIDYVVENGLMTGTSGTTFEPNTDTTRGMIVTILHRLEGEPAADEGSGFDDVAEGEWYAAAIAWATQNEIVNGYGDGSFGPGDVITREQMAAILYRYAQYKGYDVSVGESTNILSYADALEASEYATPALQWAVGFGLIQGFDESTLAPLGSATRAQVAAILMRYIEGNK